MRRVGESDCVTFTALIAFEGVADEADDDRDRGVTGGIIASSNKSCCRFGGIGLGHVSFMPAGSSMIVRFELPFDTVGDLVRVRRSICGDESRDEEMVCVSFVGGFVRDRLSICGDESRDDVPVCVSFVDNRVTNGDGVRALAAILPIRSGISITALDATVFGLSALTSRAPVVRLFVESFDFMLCTIVVGVTASAVAKDDRRLRPGFFFGVEFVFGATFIADDSSVTAVATAVAATVVAATAVATAVATVATAVPAVVAILIDFFTSFDDFVLVSVSLLVSVTFFRFVVGVDTKTDCFFGTVETTASALFATGNELVTLFLLVIGFGDKTFAANLSQLLFSGFLIDLSLA